MSPWRSIFTEVQPGIRLHAKVGSLSLSSSSSHESSRESGHDSRSHANSSVGSNPSASNPNQQKPLLVMLHGFPEYWGAWKDFLPLIDEHFRWIAPDLRGFNLSSKPLEVKAYSPRHTVGDIVGLIQAHRQGDEPVVLLAHDWGGALAWNLAAQFPQLLSHLVIVNSPHPYTFWRDLRSCPEQQAASAYMNWLRKPGCEVPLAENSFARLEEFFKKMGHSDWFDDATRTDYHTAWGQPGALTGGCNYYRASPLHPPTAETPGPLALELDPEAFRVRVPTLVIWGEADIALPKKLLEGIDPYIDQLQVKRFANNSHWILHENPIGVAQAFMGWLRENGH
jgi:epoxide hydrolase 4